MKTGYDLFKFYQESSERFTVSLQRTMWLSFERIDTKITIIIQPQRTFDHMPLYMTSAREIMKQTYMIAVLAAVLIVLIFTAPIISGVFADKTTPDLRGTWKFVSIERDSSTSDYAKTVFNKTDIDHYVIERQNGTLFEGYKEYSVFDVNRTDIVKEGLSGVITDDGKHAYINEHVDGFSIVDIHGPDMMVVYLLSETDAHGNSSQGVVRTEVARVKN